jgi:hypothetical protein
MRGSQTVGSSRIANVSETRLIPSSDTNRRRATVTHSTRQDRTTELLMDTDLIFLTYSAKLVLPYVLAGNCHTT